MRMFHVITLCILTFGAFAELIFLAGIAAVHAELADTFSQTNANNALGFAWWTLFYVLGLLITTAVATVLSMSMAKDVLKGLQHLLISLLAAAFAMVTQVCHSAVVLARNTKSGDLDSRADALAAGAIMVAIDVIALLLWLGFFDFTGERVRPQEKWTAAAQAQKVPAPPPPPPPPPPGPPPPGPPQSGPPPPGHPPPPQTPHYLPFEGDGRPGVRLDS